MKTISALRHITSGVSLLSLLGVPVTILAQTTIDNGEIVTVPGSQTTPWIVGNALAVGYDNSGTLVISNGGEVSDTYGLIGFNDTSVGVVTVSDSGSQWNNSSYLAVGYFGNGTLTISGGGHVSNTEDATIGFFSGSTGTATVAGAGSQWINSGDIYVGYSGNGSLAISEGGYVSSTNGAIGTDSDGTGVATVSGAGSQWRNSGDFSVGYVGNGTLVISDGGLVTASAAHVAYDVGSMGLLVIGAESGSAAAAPGVLEAELLEFGDGDGRIVFNHTATDYVFDATLNGGADNAAGSGTGLAGSGLVQALAGRTIFNADHGDFTGTLQASAAGILQVNGDMSGGSVDVLAGGTLEGNGIVGGTENAGTIAPGTPDGSFGTLTVVGNYVGNHGTLAIATALGDDASATDKFVVTGDTSGTTNVIVTNSGGLGAETTNGIQIVEVQGGSAGVFSLQGRAAAGSYEYFLYQGSIDDPDDGDWYLRSSLDPVLRPELATYLTNQRTAMSMFEHTLHERMGEPGLSGIHDGNARGAGWVRVKSRKLDAGVIGNQLETESDLDMVQVGADIQRNIGVDGRLHLGAMAGYGRARTYANSLLSGYSANGKVEGPSLGVYGTWFQNSSSVTGLYVDSWLQYGRYDNEVRGQWLRKEKYDSTTWSGSVEAGYALALREDDVHGFYIEPQAQVIYTRYRGDTHTEANGTRIAHQSNNHTTTRLGVRAYSRPLNYGTGNRMQPFVLLNWWSGGEDSAVRMNDVRTRHRIANDRYEARIGAQTELGQGWSGWGSFGVMWGSNDFRDYDGRLGLKYNW